MNEDEYYVGWKKVNHERHSDINAPHHYSFEHPKKGSISYLNARDPKYKGWYHDSVWGNATHARPFDSPEDAIEHAMGRGKHKPRSQGSKPQK